MATKVCYLVTLALVYILFMVFGNVTPLFSVTPMMGM
jgi:hypothetical protein